MPTREEIVQEYKTYFPDRAVSEGDIANAQERGLGIVRNTYEQITNPQVETPPLATSQEQGQRTDTADLFQKESALRGERKSLTAGKETFLDLLSKATEAKREQVLPLQKREGKLKERLFDVSPQDYKNMRPSDALSAMREDYSMIRGELNEIENRRREAIERENNFVSGVRSMFEDQINALGLEIEGLGFRRAAAVDERGFAAQQEQDIRDFAFTPTVLLSGQMPAGLPPEMEQVWQAASAEAQRQQAVAERPRGGGSARAPEDPEQDFRQDVGELIFALDSGEVQWGTAFDFLRSQYPNKSPEEIDRALGGGLDTETQQYTGRARPGYFEELTGQSGGVGVTTGPQEDVPDWLK